MPPVFFVRVRWVALMYCTCIVRYMESVEQPCACVFLFCECEMWVNSFIWSSLALASSSYQVQPSLEWDFTEHTFTKKHFKTNLLSLLCYWSRSRRNFYQKVCNWFQALLNVYKNKIISSNCDLWLSLLCWLMDKAYVYVWIDFYQSSKTRF